MEFRPFHSLGDSLYFASEKNPTTAARDAACWYSGHRVLLARCAAGFRTRRGMGKNAFWLSIKWSTTCHSYQWRQHVLHYGKSQFASRPRAQGLPRSPRRPPHVAALYYHSQHAKLHGRRMEAFARVETRCPTRAQAQRRQPHRLPYLALHRG